VNRDTTETEWVATFSDCHQSPDNAPEQTHPALFPPTWAVPLKLTLTTPIDTSTAAAGDVIRAKLAEDVPGPSPKVWGTAGATLTGRIMSMEHHLHRLDYSDPDAHDIVKPGRYSFLIWVDFDTIEANGATWSIRARLTCGHPLNREHTCSFATMSDQKWDRALVFESDTPDANIVVPAGYQSTWLTGEPPSR
jgi:hypothetical protein